MYRALALKAKERSISPEDGPGVNQLASSLSISFVAKGEDIHVLCDGDDVTEAIRLPEISRLASEISKKKRVRDALVQKQREIGRKGGVVLEGRDIGTVVFPNADLKFYLDADTEERGRRRFNELVKKGVEVNFKETLDEVKQRDHNDMARVHSPLKKADDAVLIDSTYLSIEEVVEEMVRIVEKRMNCFE
jgi:cytidylate kinase